MRELEDYNWFPQSFRQHQMDFLSLLALKFQLYKPVQPIIEEMLILQKYPGWTDACSGSGGPVLSLSHGYPVLLTDLHPGFAHLQLPSHIQFMPVSVDITRALPPGEGLITLFNSFHHFTGRQQGFFLDSCKKAGRSMLAVEVLQPGIRSFFLVLLTTTLGHWLLVPFMKPFSLKRLLLTYLLPVHTLSVLYDGILSVFKSKSSRYLQNLAQQYHSPDYRVEFLKIKGRFGPLYLIKGHPASPQS